MSGVNNNKTQASEKNTNDLSPNFKDQGINTSLIEINASINSLESAIEDYAKPAWYESPLALTIISAFFAALAAYLFNLIHWYITEKRQKTLNMGDILNTHIQNLQESAVSYWLEPTTPANQAEMKALEIQIMCQLKNLNRTINSFTECKKIKKDKPFCQSLIRYKSDFFDTITSASFGSKSKIAEPRVANRIAHICTTANSLIDSKLFEI